MGLTEQEQNRVMRTVQRAVPLEEAPFARIGEETGISEAEVLGLLRRWTEQGKLREISGILEGSALGYESALVAGAVDEADLPRVVQIVNAHPTVTHNYLRNHAFNLWYTIAAPVQMGLDATLAVLSRLSGVEFHALRRTATFKIGVNFDLETRKNDTAASPLSGVEPLELRERDRRLFRALQTPLPLTERPFHELAARLGLDADELLAFGRRHLGGAMRRYVGTLRHRQLGVRANAMIVWRAPAERTAKLGHLLAQASEVSHCYARNAIEGFPYTLYSMVHGPDLESCERVAERLAAQLGLQDYALLVSLEEYRKTRLRYFLPELDEWWARHALTDTSR
jgi:DNA-binding Lrp family transcriptional regulator